jgi:hypothetical protein
LNKRPVIREILEIIPIYLVKDDNDELGIKGAFVKIYFISRKWFLEIFHE